jgi:hypothetical protein
MKGRTTFPLREQLGDDAVDGVDGDGEADAGADAAGGIDRGVDADESSRAVEQRAAGVAGIDRGVGLDDVFDRASGDGLDRSPSAAEHAGGERLIEAERVADREGFLTDLKIGAFADGDRSELARGRVDAQSARS